MTAVYGLGVWIGFSMTRRLSTIRDLSIRDEKTGCGVHGVCVKFALYLSLDNNILSMNVEMIEFASN